MRDIKFRGQRIDNGEWIEGQLLYDEENNKACIAEYYDDDSAYMRRIVPTTVGQYTGLKDLNGREIYEGDIVEGQRESDEAGVIVTFGVFNVECCGCCYDHHQVVGFNLTGGLYDGTLPTFEVIGNIHDKGAAV